MKEKIQALIERLEADRIQARKDKEQYSYHTSGWYRHECMEEHCEDLICELTNIISDIDDVVEGLDEIIGED